MNRIFAQRVLDAMDEIEVWQDFVGTVGIHDDFLARWHGQVDVDGHGSGMKSQDAA